MKVLLVVCFIIAGALAKPAPSGSDPIPASFFGLQPPQTPTSGESDSGSDEDGFFFLSPSMVFNPFRLFTLPALPAFPDFFSDFGSPASNPDNKLINSTTETKVVNGHKVVIKDSTYENANGFGRVHVHTVQVAPDSSETTNTRDVEALPPTTNTKDVEVALPPTTNTKEAAPTTASPAAPALPEKDSGENDVREMVADPDPNDILHA